MNIRAIILIGGLGTRLAVFPDRPKALAQPVGNRVFLARQLEWLAACGVGSAHLAAGHLAGCLQNWLASARLPMPATISVEPAPLGTGGGPAFCRAACSYRPFFGCEWRQPAAAVGFAGDVGRPPARRRHGDYGRGAGDRQRYGLVEFDAGGTVRAFREKARRNRRMGERRSLPGWPGVAGGPAGRAAAIFAGAGCVSRVGGRQRRIRAWTSPPPLLDMGTPDRLQRMADYFYPQIAQISADYFTEFPSGEIRKPLILRGLASCVKI